MSLRVPAACALVVCAGCATGGAPVRDDLDALRAEVRALRRENDELARKVDALSGRMEIVTSRLSRGSERAAAAAATPPQAAPAPVVPPDLAVVKLAPPRASGRKAPPVPTAVPISEPDPAALDALARPSRRELSEDASAELGAARRRTGLDRAHALEDFAARYPRHGSADNAIVEAAAAYSGEGKGEAACTLARRVPEDYPAGDAMSDALELLAACAAQRNGAEGERRLLERLVREYPKSPAAQRAGARLATLSRTAGENAPDDRPERSTP